MHLSAFFYTFEACKQFTKYFIHEVSEENFYNLGGLAVFLGLFSPLSIVFYICTAYKAKLVGSLML